MAKKIVDPRIPEHTSGLAIVISIIATLSLVVSLFLILAGFTLAVVGIASLPFGIALFIFSMVLFGIAELVHNSGFQNKLLTEILKQTYNKELSTKN